MRLNMSDFMSLQLGEIEKYRLVLSQSNQKQISFDEAALLWVSQGLAEKFRASHPCQQKEPGKA